MQDSHYTVLLLVELVTSQSTNRTSRSINIPSHAVHSTLFQSRPGLTIWQVSWHPGTPYVHTQMSKLSIHVLEDTISGIRLH